MSDREDPSVPSVEPAGFHGTLDRVIRVAQIVQLVARNDAVLSSRQGGQPVVISRFLSHGKPKGKRGASSPP